MNDFEINPYLKFSEIRKICETHIAENDGKMYNEEEATLIMDWITKCKVSSILADMVIAGIIDITEIDVDCDPMLKLTAKGKEIYQDITKVNPEIAAIFNMNFGDESTPN